MTDEKNNLDAILGICIGVYIPAKKMERATIIAP
jgi:hypothetical protein